jgi:hypothetical protein
MINTPLAEFDPLLYAPRSVMTKTESQCTVIVDFVVERMGRWFHCTPSRRSNQLA